MTAEKILEIVEVYRKFFEERHIKKIDYPHDKLLMSKIEGLRHCHGMLDKIVEFVREGKKEKACRWLGFIQGYLWGQGIYTLNNLKNHNRPD